jgi:hypothetical protein
MSATIGRGSQRIPDRFAHVLNFARQGIGEDVRLFWRLLLFKSAVISAQITVSVPILSRASGCCDAMAEENRTTGTVFDCDDIAWDLVEMV